MNNLQKSVSCSYESRQKAHVTFNITVTGNDAAQFLTKTVVVACVGRGAGHGEKNNLKRDLYFSINSFL